LIDELVVLSDLFVNSSINV